MIAAGKTRAFVAAALVLGMGAPSARADDYPARAVKIVVGFAAGSGPDIQARTVGQQLQNTLGQTFYIENRLGANGTIAARSVARSEPDGYTLLFSSSSIAPTPHIYRNLGYDTLADLKPIATTGILDGLLMLVRADFPARSVAEFIEFARRNEVHYGSPGVGNGLHLATEIFKLKARVDLRHVPYKGTSEVLTALLGGSIQVMFVTPPSVMGVVNEGRVRALAFTGSKPFAELSDLPLMSDLVPGFEPVGSWGMFFAPGKTPSPILEKLNVAIQDALRAPGVASVMQRDGYVPDGRSVEATSEFFAEEVQRAGEAVKAANIQPN